MLINCLITKDTLPLWVQAIGIFGTVYLAWATLKNRETINELIASNRLNADRLLIERQEQFKRSFPFLTGSVQPQTESTQWPLHIRNSGAPIPVLNIRNRSGEHFTFDPTRINALATNAEWTITIRVDPGFQFDNLEIDFVCVAGDGKEKTKTFHKLPGINGYIDPPADYLLIK